MAASVLTISFDNKNQGKTTIVQHFEIQQSVRTCQSVADSKLFNVYDEVSPAMIMRDSRSSLMISFIFDEAAWNPRWFHCTLLTVARPGLEEFLETKSEPGAARGKTRQ